MAKKKNALKPAAAVAPAAPKPVTFETVYFGRTVGEWAKLTREERLADNQIGEVRILELDDLIVRATGHASLGEEGPPIEKREPTTDPEKVELLTDPVERNQPPLEPPAATDLSDTPTPVEPIQHAAADEFGADDDHFAAVMHELSTAPAPCGYCTRSPTPSLTAEQANLQSQLAAILTARGVILRSQGQVYGWLLDQIAAAVK